MKKFFFMPLICLGLLVACDVDQTQEARLPDVDVDVDATAGQLPEFDVDWADVNVGTRTTTIKVPKVVVVMEEEEVEVPYVDVDMPNDDEKEEKTLVVEAEVRNNAHDLEIAEVYATGKRLYVISRLEATDQEIGDQTMRVSDRLVLNAPDLDVKHYIIGKKPSGDHNNQYTYITDISQISNKISKGKKIYGS